jgi:hypothetical protein
VNPDTIPLDPGTVPTVTDSANREGLLSSYEISVSFEPTTSTSTQNGELTFGGVDPSRFTGSINFMYVDLTSPSDVTSHTTNNTYTRYRPLTSTSPASAYVGIDQTITYGASRIPILDATAGIVDTGTTLLLLASGRNFQYFDHLY